MCFRKTHRGINETNWPMLIIGETVAGYMGVRYIIPSTFVHI